MTKYVWLVFTEPKPGQEDEYNDWYDHQHLGDVVALEGITAAHRYELAEVNPGDDRHHRHLALYEIETDDVAKIPQAIAAAKEVGRMPISDALDQGATVTVYYRARSSE